MTCFTYIGSSSVVRALEIKGNLSLNKSRHFSTTPKAAQLKEHLDLNKKAFERIKSENLKKYGHVYKEFFDRNGPDWYEDATGKTFDEDRAYRDVIYLKKCIESGIMHEENKKYIEELKRSKKIQRDSLELEMIRLGISNTRRVLIFLATPEWADQEKIKEIHEKRREITKLTGVEYHVDHIIPLNNHLVCGLNVPDNLQIITARNNWAKKNSFDIE